MPKGFTPQEKELIGERLLEQGYRQFSLYGLKKTTVEELASAAGISKGAFYLFYESKEALFMDVMEEVEKRFRQEILAAIDLPGSSPRARLLAVLRKAFSQFKTIPMLQFFGGSDYDLLFRRVPPHKLQEHLDSDRVFFDELIDRCRQAGIPISAPSEQVRALVYALVLSIIHEDDWGVDGFAGAADILLELVAAFCLGEIVVKGSGRPGPGYLTPEEIRQ